MQKQREKELETAYEAVSKDKLREAEAKEWSKCAVNDVEVLDEMQAVQSIPLCALHTPKDDPKASEYGFQKIPPQRPRWNHPLICLLQLAGLMSGYRDWIGIDFF